MSNILCSTVIALSLSLLPAQAQVIGEYEWEFEEDGEGCYAGVLSHSADARFQLVTTGDRISGFIMSKSRELDELSVEQEVSIFGVFDNGSYIQLGKLMLVGREPLEIGKQEDWAWFMFEEPNLTGDKRFLENETLTIFTLPDPVFNVQVHLGTFPLRGARKTLISLAQCAQ